MQTELLLVVALLHTTELIALCSSDYFYLIVVGLAILCNPSSPSGSTIAEHQAIELLIPTTVIL